MAVPFLRYQPKNCTFPRIRKVGGGLSFSNESQTLKITFSIILFVKHFDSFVSGKKTKKNNSRSKESSLFLGLHARSLLFMIFPISMHLHHSASIPPITYSLHKRHHARNHVRCIFFFEYNKGGKSLAYNYYCGKEPFTF